MKIDIKVEPKNIDKILKNLIILIDTREQENSHITTYLDKHKVRYVKKKLNYGDYSCYLEKNEELGIPCDISFENEIAIERKGSSGSGLSELAGNLTKGRDTFENEMIRATKCNFFGILIENGSLEKIINGQYRSEYNAKSYYNTLLSWERKYKFHLHFLEQKYSGLHIKNIFEINVKKLLTNDY